MGNSVEEVEARCPGRQVLVDTAGVSFRGDRGCAFGHFLIFSLVTGGSGFSYMPEGVSWVQISMRSLSLRLGSLRAHETAKKGRGVVGEAPL